MLPSQNTDISGPPQARTFGAKTQTTVEPLAMEHDHCGTENASPASGEIVAMGRQLEALLADPDAHTIGDFAAILERLHRELSLVPQNVAAATGDDADLAALFEHDFEAAALSANDIDDLARSLEQVNGTAVAH